MKTRLFTTVLEPLRSPFLRTPAGKLGKGRGGSHSMLAWAEQRKTLGMNHLRSESPPQNIEKVTTSNGAPPCLVVGRSAHIRHHGTVLRTASVPRDNSDETICKDELSLAVSKDRTLLFESSTILDVMAQMSLALLRVVSSWTVIRIKTHCSLQRPLIRISRSEEP